MREYDIATTKEGWGIGPVPFSNPVGCDKGITQRDNGVS
jgi:hypothetical protein